MTFRSLYHTEVINDAGLNGHARVTLGGDLDVLTSSPLQDDPGTNPEQLLGLALATCLINIGRKSRDFSHGMDRLLLTSFRAFFYFIVLLIIDILLNDLLAHIP